MGLPGRDVDAEYYCKKKKEIKKRKKAKLWVQCSKVKTGKEELVSAVSVVCSSHSGHLLFREKSSKQRPKRFKSLRR